MLSSHRTLKFCPLNQKDNKLIGDIFDDDKVYLSI